MLKNLTHSTLDMIFRRKDYYIIKQHQKYYGYQYKMF